jgi:hypothetical protein
MECLLRLCSKKISIRCKTTVSQINWWMMATFSFDTCTIWCVKKFHDQRCPLKAMNIMVYVKYLSIHIGLADSRHVSWIKSGEWTDLNLVHTNVWRQNGNISCRLSTSIEHIHISRETLVSDWKSSVWLEQKHDQRYWSNRRITCTMRNSVCCCIENTRSDDTQWSWPISNINVIQTEEIQSEHSQQSYDEKFKRFKCT